MEPVMKFLNEGKLDNLLYGPKHIQGDNVHGVPKELFIEPMQEIYAGQVIGESTRQDDLVLNVIKTKKLSNMRASGSDDKISIAPAIKFSLEEAMEYVGNDEYVEVTPKSIRIRKIVLNELERKKIKKSEG